ncbi:phosphate metabolism transcription is regulated by PHO system [Suhomyces tanzawaensis NRRL Y-17324]|uniref:Endopolyphosphatase n=1 Tax=Suhomyces tanzawaensis NRRL Y-17324 TaxID=984487 RepID=A0A1E4SRH4_9ASCO|nr:phosphate metabolism transcription is regulated by PHO system [Suhomyces tanzawaensis NRRL Y-17324]ODV82109.1 phosphate metabolism transcription is regulated by PHO system [Suhomyces tanzawaensis NRRL Y-17324]
MGPVAAEELELSQAQRDELRRLGLTPKSPVRVISAENGERIINGRFLHITDMHPDPHYREGMLPEELACHSPGEGKSGKYGDAILGCDSPMILVNDTVAWIKKHLKDKIDFVVWTGDNIRHDNDRRFPRTEQSIFDMNQQVSDLMYEAFKDDQADDHLRKMQVDLIPSLGNNDVYPHNLFSPGPTLQTREMFKIWQNYIPQSQLHIFNRGAYFFQEVIPGHLAVLSINTLYLFQSNPLVDNCDSKKQPGYKLFEWLGYVLKEMRARNMKVWLTGHVPPNEKNYDISCLRKYIVWTHEYRDVIIGGLYGHMNIDHFIPLDSVAAYKSIKKSLKGQAKAKDLSFVTTIEDQDSDWEYESDSDDEFTAALEESDIYKTFEEFGPEFRIQGGVPSNKVKYMESLRETVYAKIKGRRKSGNHAERYSIAHVTASVVPTFNSGIRVWEYNITGLRENIEFQAKYGFAPWDQFFTGLNSLFQSLDEEDEESYWILKKDKTLPPKMPDNLPLGPAYIPQTFTPERYVQYYLDLEQINSGDKKFGYEIEYATDDKLYGMKDLTVKEWIKYGRKLGQPVKDATRSKKKPSKKKKKQQKQLEKLWDSFLKNSFVSSDYENKGYG